MRAVTPKLTPMKKIHLQEILDYVHDHIPITVHFGAAKNLLGAVGKGTISIINVKLGGLVFTGPNQGV